MAVMVVVLDLIWMPMRRVTLLLPPTRASIHLRPEKLKTVASKNVPPQVNLTDLAGIHLYIVLINGSHSVVSSLLIHYTHFAYVGIQLRNLPAATVTTLLPPAVASVEVIATSEPIDPGVGALN